MFRRAWATLGVVLLLLTTGAVQAQSPPTPAPVSVMCATCTAQLSVTNAAAHVALPSTNSSLKAITLYNAGTKDLFWVLGATGTNATTANNRLPAGTSVTVFQGTATFVSAIMNGADTSTLDVLQANGPLSRGGNFGGSGGSSSPFITAMSAVSAIANFGGL